MNKMELIRAEYLYCLDSFENVRDVFSDDFDSYRSAIEDIPPTPRISRRSSRGASRSLGKANILTNFIDPDKGKTRAWVSSEFKRAEIPPDSLWVIEKPGATAFAIRFCTKDRQLISEEFGLLLSSLIDRSEKLPVVLSIEERMHAVLLCISVLRDKESVLELTMALETHFHRIDSGLKSLRKQFCLIDEEHKRWCLSYLHDYADKHGIAGSRSLKYKFRSKERLENELFDYIFSKLNSLEAKSLSRDLLNALAQKKSREKSAKNKNTVQLNLPVSKEARSMLKSMSMETGISMGVLLERAIKESYKNFSKKG